MPSDDPDPNPLEDTAVARISVELGDLRVEVEGESRADAEAMFDRAWSDALDELTAEHEAVRELSRGYW